MKLGKFLALTTASVILIILAIGLAMPSDAYIPEYGWQMSPNQSCINGLYCMDCCASGTSTCYQSECRPYSDLNKSCNPVF